MKSFGNTGVETEGKNSNEMGAINEMMKGLFKGGDSVIENL